jgi:hypothetical protein
MANKAARILDPGSPTGVSDIKGWKKRWAADGLDEKLSKEYEDMFGSKNAKIKADDARRYLDKIRKKYPEVRTLYPSPQELVDEAEKRRTPSAKDVMRPLL